MDEKEAQESHTESSSLVTNVQSVIPKNRFTIKLIKQPGHSKHTQVLT